MIIRKGKLSDATGIARVHVDSWKETYKGIIPNSVLESRTYEKQEKMWKGAFSPEITTDKIILVAEDSNGKIVGFLTGGENREKDAFPNHDAELYAIYILQKVQKQGVGKKLNDQFTAFLRERDYHSVMVWVLEDNPAVDFYTHIGGKPIGRKSEEIGGKILEEVALCWMV
ncbi:GNAT family N-acetyltransferase [Alteribacter populi]|uniref:GNAT family N-acetyltransferase n=1 Tax=Alteribacter populi TaxID=2011011 RepID=UPI001E335CAE|nr:GNAT family N-acetyltransferase [Alteribacter populi]